LRVVSLSVPFLMTQNCIAPYTCGSMDMKSEAQVTPASVKQAQKVGIVVSVEEMGGSPKSTPRICSKAVASLRVETMMLVVVVVVC
jgi:anti-sigma-K factor RskA